METGLEYILVGVGFVLAAFVSLALGRSRWYFQYIAYFCIFITSALLVVVINAVLTVLTPLDLLGPSLLTSVISLFVLIGGAILQLRLLSRLVTRTMGSTKQTPSTLSPEQTSEQSHNYQSSSSTTTDQPTGDQSEPQDRGFSIGNWHFGAAAREHTNEDS